MTYLSQSQNRYCSSICIFLTDKIDTAVPSASFSQTKPILQFRLQIYKFDLLISGLENIFSARVHDCGPILLKASSLSIPLL